MAAETYATDNNGSYSGVNASMLNSITPALNTNTGNGQAYLQSASGHERLHGRWRVADRHRAVHADQQQRYGDFSCSPAGTGACSSSSTW